MEPRTGKKPTLLFRRALPICAGVALCECVIALLLVRAIAGTQRDSSLLRTDITGTRVAQATTEPDSSASYLPAVSDEALVLRHLVELVGSEGLYPISFSPGEAQVDEDSPVAHVPVSLVVDGQYDRIGDLMRRLRELEDAPVRVEAFEITPSPEGLPLVRGAFKLSVVFSEK